MDKSWGLEARYRDGDKAMEHHYNCFPVRPPSGRWSSEGSQKPTRRST